MSRIFLGFGFGPIQAGLFLYEAHRSGNFDRLVVAEVLQPVVDAVRAGGGRYTINVATRAGVEIHEIHNVEILNPQTPADRKRLVELAAHATEIATALPSIDFFNRGGEAAVAALLADAFKLKKAGNLPPCVVYTAENHNHAAEALETCVATQLGQELANSMTSHVQYLNTVIGKMSGVVTDPAHISRRKLARAVPGWDRAFLIEEFNRILVSRITLPAFKRGIQVFLEKDDLLPFEEAKLYGHNATHALMGYLGHERQCHFMSQLSEHPDIVQIARQAFIEESGAALVRRYGGMDELFTNAGYTAYATDLLDRMTNPYLEDQVARIIRDPRRKLGWDDRLIGTMRLALAHDIQPNRYARGAAAALRFLATESAARPSPALLDELWPPSAPATEVARLKALVAATL